jgi:hypothetical protein
MFVRHTVERVTFGSPESHVAGISPISCVPCRYSSLKDPASWLVGELLPHSAGRVPVMLVWFRSRTLSCSADQAAWKKQINWLLQTCMMQQQQGCSQRLGMLFLMQGMQASHHYLK